MPCLNGGPDEVDMLTQTMCLLADVIARDDEAFADCVRKAKIHEEEKWCSREYVINRVLQHRAKERRFKFKQECWRRAPEEIPIKGVRFGGAEKTYTDEHGNSFRFVRNGRRGLLWEVYDAVTGKDER